MGRNYKDRKVFDKYNHHIRYMLIFPESDTYKGYFSFHFARLVALETPRISATQHNYRKH